MYPIQRWKNFINFITFVFQVTVNSKILAKKPPITIKPTITKTKNPMRLCPWNSHSPIL